MSLDSTGADGLQSVDPSLHHISSIAHLFFGEDEKSDPLVGRRTSLQLAVACCNDSRIAAFTCGQLVKMARRVVVPAQGQAVRLLQETGLTWSARSFLTADGTSAESGIRNQSGKWTWPEVTADDDIKRLVCWTHLQEGRDRATLPVEYLGGGDEATPAKPVVGAMAPGLDGLVVCLLAHEVGGLSAGVRLGRLVGQIEPRRLEILVFPDSWDVRRRGEDRGPRWFGLPRDRNRDLLARCRDLTRALVGSCSVTITKLPGGNLQPDSAAVATILQKLASRLIGNFWVDPGS